MTMSALHDEPFEEFAHLRGLLLWLAWDSNVGLDERFGIAEELEDIEQRVLDKAALLEIVPPVALDDVATSEANASIQHVARSSQLFSASSWFQKHIDWAGRINQLPKVSMPADRPNLRICVGDIAYIPSSKNPVLMVVSKVTGNAVGFAAFGGGPGEVSFIKDRVAALHFT